VLPLLTPTIFARSLIPVRPLLIARLFSLALPATLAYSSALAHTSTLTRLLVFAVHSIPVRPSASVFSSVFNRPFAGSKEEQKFAETVSNAKYPRDANDPGDAGGTGCNEPVSVREHTYGGYLRQD